MAARGRGLFSLYIYIKHFKILFIRNYNRYSGSVIERPLFDRGGYGFDPRPCHTKEKVELELVSSVSV